MASALELLGVTKRYPQFTLDDVTLRVERGTIMGLIGENGAGKTTTLKLLLGLIRPDCGMISVLGEVDERSVSRKKARIGVVLEDGFFPDVFLPWEVDAVCAKAFPNWRREAFAGWLRRLSLPNDKQIRELSKGMKKKLAIAVALSHEPELLVLDEATSGLDPVVRDEILDVFLEFMQDDTHSILFSTHITADLERVADQITFLHAGRVVLQKSKDDILASYGVLKCGTEAFEALDPRDYTGYRKSKFGVEVLLRDRGVYLRRQPDAVVDRASLDEIMLYTVRGDRQ